MDRAAQHAQTQLDKQIEILDTLRNATTRGQEFREWRQHTLTLIERVWPEQAARAQRFRRVPFSPASARADERAVREAFERGCAEARRLLQLWTAEIATHGLNHEAEAPRLAEAVRATLSEAMPDSDSLDLAPIGDVGLDDDGDLEGDADGDGDEDAPAAAPPSPARAGLPPRPPRPGITPVTGTPASPQAQRPSPPRVQGPLPPRPAQGQRAPSPQAQRPATPQGPRPVAPQGQRPGAPSQGQRPTPPGQRPSPPPSGQRPAAPQGQRPSQPQGQRPSPPPPPRAAEPPRRDRGKLKGQPPLKEMLGFERPLPGDDDDMGMPEFDATFRGTGTPSHPAPPPAKPASSRPAMAPTPEPAAGETDDEALRRMLEMEIEALESGAMSDFDDHDAPDEGEYSDDALEDDPDQERDDEDAREAHDPPLEIENNSFLRHTTDSTSAPPTPRPREAEFRPLDTERVPASNATPPARPASAPRPQTPAPQPSASRPRPPAPPAHATPRPQQPAARRAPPAPPPAQRPASPNASRPATPAASRPAPPAAAPPRPAPPPSRPTAPAAKAPMGKAPAAPAPSAKLEVERFERPQLPMPSRPKPKPAETRDPNHDTGDDALADALGAALERARHDGNDNDGSDHFAGEDFGPDDASDDLGMGDPHMVSYVARTVIGLAADVDELGIPEGHRERVRLALLDLAHYLDTGNVTWAILRDAITLVMHYPALARQALPLLLPFLETAA